MVLLLAEVDIGGGSPLTQESGLFLQDQSPNGVVCESDDGPPNFWYVEYTYSQPAHNEVEPTVEVFHSAFQTFWPGNPQVTVWSSSESRWDPGP